MPFCFFASDLHGRVGRYEALWRAVRAERPRAVFLGGDLLPHAMARFVGPNPAHREFLGDYVADALTRLRDELGEAYPRFFLIFGNDDARAEEESLFTLERAGLLEYVHERWVHFEGFEVFGYAYVPPTPFQLKDWERYDVSRFVDAGCVSPEEGRRTVDVPPHVVRYRTIAEDLATHAEGRELGRSVLLFHTPPYKTALDRAALDGKMIEHVPLDVHIGSIAVRRFVEARQPYLTMHGHVHEAARLTGRWRERLGETEMFGGAHDGSELALVRFELGDLASAERVLIETES